MSPTERLELVREEIEVILQVPGRGGWTDDTARRYAELCLREATLLARSS